MQIKILKAEVGEILKKEVGKLFPMKKIELDKDSYGDFTFEVTDYPKIGEGENPEIVKEDAK